MLETIFSFTAAVSMFIGSLFGSPVEEPTQPPFNYSEVPVIYADEPRDELGAFSPAAGGTYRLQSSIGTTDTTLRLSSFEEPITGTPLTMTSLATDIAYGTIDPQSSTRKEFISFTGITQNSDGTATLTGVTRGLGFISPFTASSTLRKAHPGQSIFILSDSPQFFNEYARRRSNETITGQWTFTNFPITASSAFASATTSGWVELATGAEAASSTIVGNISSSKLALHTGIATSSCPTSGNVVIVTGDDGNIHNNCLPTIITATTTFTGNSNLGIRTVKAGATINGATLPVPVYQNKTDNEFYASDGNATATLKYLGFAISNGTNGNDMVVQYNGIVGGFSGLDEGEKYYVQDAVGTIGTSPGTYEVLVGVAISPTQLMIQKGSRRFAGTTTFSDAGADGAVSTLALSPGFRPSKINFSITRNGASGAATALNYVSAVWINGTYSVVYTATDSDSTPGSTGGAGSSIVYYQTSSPVNDHWTITVTSVTDYGFTITATQNDTSPESIALMWEAQGEL